MATRFAGVRTINAAGANVIDRTNPLQMDGNITNGVVNVPLNNSYVLTNAVLTRNAAGDVSINVAATVTANIDFLLGEYFKECTALLNAASIPPLNNSGQYADGSGDTPLSKGTLITGITLAYSVQTAGLTTFTAGMWLNVSAQGVANVLTNPIPQAQNGLVLATTASATTCNVTTIPVPVGSQAFDVALVSQATLELIVTTPATSTFRLYGVSLNVTYNYL